MKTTSIRLTALMASIACVIGLQPFAQALDTDVYLKAQAVGTSSSPNVMIILDTSGSMNDVVQSGEYDPLLDYCGADLDAVTGYAGANAAKPSDCASTSGRIYWSFDGNPPSMTSDQWFSASKNKCIDSLSSLDNNNSNDPGFYGSTKAARWINGSNWSSLSGQTDATITYVDCQADGNRDGLSNNDGQRPRSSTSTAYTTSSGSAFSWSSFNNSSGNTTRPTLYSANYMNWVHNSVLTTAPTITRIQAAKTAVKAIIDGNKSVRFGLMVFNRNGSGQDGGRVIFKIANMDDARRTSMKTVVDNVVASGNTPLAETLWEAYRYFAGKTVDFGDNDTSATPARDLTAETGGTASTGGTYISPFAFSCQTAFTIYVTDGDPTSDSAGDTKIKALPGMPATTCAHSDSNPQNSCLKDLAGWMHNNDILTGAGALTDTQSVTTFTVGFGTGISAGGEALLQATATQGGGEYKLTNNAATLTAALQSALVKALDKPTSFTAPSLSVNAFNRLYNRDDLFLALFEPSNACSWPGNIKKYRLCSQADIDANRCDKLSDILDANNQLATDSNNFIKTTAQSKWSSLSDGAEVTSGAVGVAMPAPAARVVYTYPGSYTGLSSSTPATPVNVEINASNSFYTYVTADPARLGLPVGAANPGDVDTLINWMRGADSYNKWTYVPAPTTDPRAPKYVDTPTLAGNTSDNTRRWAFGDVLHSRPVAITYGGTDAAPIMKLFVGTNDGGVHMIRNDTGAEQWSFIPKEMYSMQYAVAQAADGDHYVGIDSTPTFWVIDNNKDGIIDPTANDKVYMYIGMRRGGANIYAFDVTPASKMTSDNDTLVPKLMWVIQGGSGNFAKLGQTWSRPLVTRIRVKCNVASCNDGDSSTPDSTTKVVLIFGGGYDTNQDNNVAAGPDSVGNAIFMVDPLTGQRLWWASNASGTGAYLQLQKMNFGIPSDLTLLDTDGDGSTDRFYVGDMGGQLWRIDLDNQLDPGVSNGNTSGYVFADIGCAAEAENSSTIGTAYTHDATGACPSGATKQGQRRIFYPPDVAPISDTTFSANPNYDMVTFGSGDREDPLDFLTEVLTTPDSKEAVHNRIYAFRDYNYATGAPVTTPSTPLSEADLYNATANLLGTSSGAALTTQINALKAKKGWYLDLKNASDILMPSGLTTHWVGEKVLAGTTIEDGVLKVTTYTPANEQNTATNTNSCNANEGVATLWGLSILNATAAVDFDGDGTNDRSIALGSGIPSEVVRIFLPDGNTSLVQAGGGLHSGGPDDDTGGLKRNSWQGCLGSPSGDTALCGQ